MKKLTAILFLPLIFSCGRNSSEKSESGNILENLTFKVDTVMVDLGEEILNLSQGIRLSDFSPGKKSLYLYNEVDQSICVLDLDALRLVDKIQFEKEGPNGIGKNLSKIQLLAGNRILANNYQKNSIFNLRGQKEITIKPSAENIDNLSKDEELTAGYGLLLSRDEKKFFSLPEDFLTGTRKLMIANFPSQKGKVVNIPAMDITADLRVVWKIGDRSMISVQEIFLQELDEKLIVSNAASSDIYIYDMNLDSLQLKINQHVLVPNRKELNVKSEVTSTKDFQAEMIKINQQISFERFLDDPKTTRYYRFGMINLPKSTPEAELKSDVFLFAYDQNFNLIGETHLKELTSVPQSPFFKDGKLWSYVNVDDELGFAVMNFKF